jgi:hypothetical protein
MRAFGLRLKYSSVSLAALPFSESFGARTDRRGSILEMGVQTIRVLTMELRVYIYRARYLHNPEFQQPVLSN